MFEITTTYNIWWLFPIFLIAVGLSLLLYYKNSKEDFPTIVLILLGLLRFSTFFILGFLLLSPLLKSWKTNIEKPVIVLGIDNSKSNILYADSTQLRKEYSSIIANLKDKLGEKYDVESYGFDEQLKAMESFNFSGQGSDISNFFEQIKPKYQYRNVGAVVLVSDGIYNVGQNPFYTAKEIDFPIYSIGLGDTSIYKDYSIKHIVYNKNVFLNNSFPIEVTIMAKRLKSERVKIVVKNKSKIIASKELYIDSHKEIQKHIFFVKANKAGLISYKIEIETFDGERNTLNNTETIFVEVIGERKKVLLLYESPHPDVSAINQALSKSEEYELQLMNYRMATVNIKDYHLVIFHQIPNASSRSASIVQEAKRENVPYIMILGTKTNIQLFNTLNLGIKIESGKNSFIESKAILNNDFAEFIIPKTFKNNIQEFPPLINPYGKYSLSSSFRVILKQKIGSVETDYPLVALSEQSGKRNAFILGEGLWRWRMFDFVENKSHEAVDEFILKIIRYVSLSKTLSRFDLQWESRYSEQENVEFNAIFYNSTYEPILDADVQMEILNEEGKHFPFAFGATDHSYYLSAGRFPEGIYNFRAWIDYHGEHFEKKGSFIIDAIDIEASNLEADHQLLKRISANSSGKFFNKDQAQLLADELLNKKEIVNLESQYLQYKDLIKFKYIFALLLLMVTIEWFVRKQMGSY